jgi:hypothetical protein
MLVCLAVMGVGMAMLAGNVRPRVNYLRPIVVSPSAVVLPGLGGITGPSSPASVDVVWKLAGADGRVRLSASSIASSPWASDLVHRSRRVRAPVRNGRRAGLLRNTIVLRPSARSTVMLYGFLVCTDISPRA